MDDSTLYKVIDAHSHIPGTKIGCTQEKIDAVKLCAENEEMQSNLKKCNEILTEFQRQKRLFPTLKWKIPV